MDVKEQQEKLLVDLQEVFDAVNQMIQFQSISCVTKKLEPTELYNQHLSGNVLHMCVMFLASTINKQMEMQELQIERMRILT